MITEDIKDKIQEVKELRVENTYRAEYIFDVESNTLFIPFYETDFTEMFRRCCQLEKIDLSINNCIENIECLFLHCTKLKQIFFTKELNLQRVKDLSYMFYGCTSLEEINLQNLMTSETLFNINFMFGRCNSLKEVNFGNNFNSKNIAHTEGLFCGCSKLNIIKWGHKQLFNNLQYTSNMFDGCERLREVDLRNVDFRKITDLENMFTNTSPYLEVLVNNTFK